MSPWTIRIIPLLAIMILSPNRSGAQPRSSLGGLPGAPFRMGTSAFSMGMGNATVALRSSQIAGFDNPALTPFQPRRFGSVSSAFLTLDRRFNSVYYTQHLAPSAGISLGLIAAGVGDIDGRDKDGLHTEFYSTSENAFLLSFGLKVNPDLAIGLSPKILYYSLFNSVTSTTVGFDVGAVYALSEELMVGVSFQDLGSKYKWDTSRLYGINGNSTTDQFPVRNRLGLSYLNSGMSLLVSAEVEAVGASTFIRGGIDWRPFTCFEIRGGIDQVALSEPVRPKPGLGFTLEYPVGNWTPGFTYAFVLEPYGPGGIHVITLTVGF